METKLLDLNAYGVEEMNVAEMRETNGGLGWKIVGAFLLASLVSDLLTPGVADRFWAGYESVRNN